MITHFEKNHNVEVIITEVIDADVKQKIITTTGGTISYDYVVVAPGIDYNYKKSLGQRDKSIGL